MTRDTDHPGGLWSYDGGWSPPPDTDHPPTDAPPHPADATAPPRDRPDRARSAGADGERSRPARRGGAAGERGRRSRRDGDGPAPGHPEDAPGDPESAARAICLRLLTVQPRTRSELAAALAKRGIPDDAAETVLSRFTEVGLIDDRAFAAAWVDSRHAGRGLARRALAAELRRRGIDGEIVGEAVAVVDAEAEERAARRLVDRKLAATRRLDQPTRVRRLAGMLARKGYPPGLALGVVRDALAAEGTDPGDLDPLDDTTPDD
jgi:regulatory protein